MYLHTKLLTLGSFCILSSLALGTADAAPGSVLIGTDRTEGLVGTPGDDTIRPGRGADFIDGAAGADVVELPGKPSDYVIRTEDNINIRIFDRSDGNTKMVKNIEFYRFSDRLGELTRWDAWYGQLVPATVPASAPTPTVTVTVNGQVWGPK